MYWNLDIDRDTLPNNPCNFGTSGQYLTLKTPAHRQTVTDHDADNDNLIERQYPGQTQRHRHNLDSNGAPYVGCAATCAGYQLTGNLDFDRGPYPNRRPTVVSQLLSVISAAKSRFAVSS